MPLLKYRLLNIYIYIFEESMQCEVYFPDGKQPPKYCCGAIKRVK